MREREENKKKLQNLSIGLFRRKTPGYPSLLEFFTKPNICTLK